MKAVVGSLGRAGSMVAPDPVDAVERDYEPKELHQEGREVKFESQRKDDE